MELSTGTSGYSYKGWKGTFYPDDLPAARYLAYYAEHLSAVEINNTFYRLPRANVLERWAGDVPDGFRFAIKASRRITHFKKLAGTEDETGYLLTTLGTLGDKLGCVLFQCPPKLALDLDRLKAFTDLLPEGTRAAFEFRHPSWLGDDGVRELLRERDFALVCADVDPDDDETDASASAETEIVSTASWGYLRLRREGYEDADLERFAQRLAAEDWERAFVFFKHEGAGEGARLAARLVDLVEALPERPGVRPVRRRRAARVEGA